MLWSVVLHGHRTWIDGWMSEYKFFGGYSLDSGFLILLFSFLLPSNKLVHAGTYTHVLDQCFSTPLKLLTPTSEPSGLFRFPGSTPTWVSPRRSMKAHEFLLLIFQISDLDAQIKWRSQHWLVLESPGALKIPCLGRGGTWVAQSVEHLTLGFSSGYDLMVCGFGTPSRTFCWWCRAC